MKTEARPRQKIIATGWLLFSVSLGIIPYGCATSSSHVGIQTITNLVNKIDGQVSELKKAQDELATLHVKFTNNIAQTEQHVADKARGRAPGQPNSSAHERGHRDCRGGIVECLRCVAPSQTDGLGRGYHQASSGGQQFRRGQKSIGFALSVREQSRRGIDERQGPFEHGD